MAKAPTPKNDQIRALREAKFEKALAKQAAERPAKKAALETLVADASARADASHQRREAKKAKRNNQQQARDK